MDAEIGPTTLAIYLEIAVAPRRSILIDRLATPRKRGSGIIGMIKPRIGSLDTTAPPVVRVKSRRLATKTTSRSHLMKLKPLTSFAILPVFSSTERLVE